MKTVALRFAENFAPDCGTIAAHEELIEKNGYVWYGKLGTPISSKIATEMISNERPRFLLIHSGGLSRYWAHIQAVQREIPVLDEIPSYYRGDAAKFKMWFKVTSFEPAPKDVMSHCFVASSKKVLTEASRQSMSPYFIIEHDEEN